MKREMRGTVGYTMPIAPLALNKDATCRIDGSVFGWDALSRQIRAGLWGCR